MADTTTDTGTLDLDAPPVDATQPANPQQPPPDAGAAPTPKGFQLDPGLVQSIGDNGDGSWTVVDNNHNALTLHGNPEDYGLTRPAKAKGADSISYTDTNPDIRELIQVGFDGIKSALAGRPNPWLENSKAQLPGQQEVQPTPAPAGPLTPSSAPQHPGPVVTAAGPSVNPLNNKVATPPPALAEYDPNKGESFGSNWRASLAKFIAPNVLPTPVAGTPVVASPPVDSLIAAPGIAAMKDAALARTAQPAALGGLTPEQAASFQSLAGAAPAPPLEKLATATTAAKVAKALPGLTPEQQAALATKIEGPGPTVAPSPAGTAWAAQNLDNAGAPVVPPGSPPPAPLTASVVPSSDQTAAIANGLPAVDAGGKPVPVPPAQGTLTPEQQAQMNALLSQPANISQPANPQPMPNPATTPAPAAGATTGGGAPPAPPRQGVGVPATTASPFAAPTAEAKTAVDQQAAAQQAQNDALTKVASDTTAQLGNMLGNFASDAGDDVAAAGDRLAKFDTLSDAAADAAKNFDPNRFWTSRTAGQRLAIGIGSAFGSFAKALGGTDTSSEILGKAIDNAARGEEVKLNSQWRSAEQAAKGLDMQKEVAALRESSYLTTKANVIDLAKQRIDEETLKTNNPLILAKANALKATLDKDRASDDMRYAELRNTLANGATQRGLTQQQTIAAKLGNAGEAAVLPSKVDVELGQLGATKDQQDFARIGGYDSNPVKKQAAEQVWLKDHPAIPALLPGQNLDAMQKIVGIEKSQQEMEQNAQDRALPGGGSAPVAQAKVATGIDTGIRSVTPLLKDLDTLSDSASIGPAGRLTGPVSTEAQTQFGAKAQAIATQLISALGETARENPQLWQSLSPQIPLATDRAATIKTKTRALRQILQDAAHGAGSKVDYFPELKVRPGVK